jgi:hypothetical protein
LKLEQLEPRATPATLVNANTVTYQDVDGDTVTVKLSKPLLDDGNVSTVFTFNNTFATAGPQQLRAIDFATLSATAPGTGITTSAVRSANGGDGLAAIGHINGPLIDLGPVVIDGDLGRILAGDLTPTTPGLASLTVQSLGRFALTTGAPDLISGVAGSMGALRVRGDMIGVSIGLVGGADANVASVSVGGSIIGSSATAGLVTILAEGNVGPTVIKGDLIGGTLSPAVIVAGGTLASLTVNGSFLLGGGMSAAIGGFANVGPVKVRGSINGGAQAQTGAIISLDGGIASVSIGGSLRAGTSENSGAILAKKNIGNVIIGGDMVGVGLQSGEIFAEGNIGNVTIRGSVVGGIGNGSGLIAALGNIGQVNIGGDIRGGGGLGSGQAAAVGNLAGVRVGGSLLAGAGETSGNISAAQNLGPVVIRGSVVGGPQANSGNVLSTSAKMASLTIGGSLIGGVGSNSGQVTAGTNLGPIKIAGDLVGVGLNSGRIFAPQAIASVAIGGSIKGGDGSSGSISAGTTLGPVSVVRDVVGGAGISSATISSNGSMPKVSIGGSLFGGIGNLSGQVNPGGAAGTIKVGGDIVGGIGVNSGVIAATAGATKVTIGGSVRGGTGSGSGGITANQAIGAIAILGDLIGGSAATGDLVRSGSIQAGRIGSLAIGGSLISGVDATAGVFQENGSILSGNDIASILIKGGIVGNATHAALISARGSATPTATSDIAIGKLNVLGRVEFAKILGGFDRDGTPINGDAQIGTVTVGGDWIASSLATGALAAGTGFFGDIDVFKITGGGAKDEGTISSAIASVTINGQAFGTLAGGDFYGIVAESVGLVKVGGATLPTTAGDDEFLVGASGDFQVNEL